MNPMTRIASTVEFYPTSPLRPSNDFQLPTSFPFLTPSFYIPALVFPVKSVGHGPSGPTGASGELPASGADVDGAKVGTNAAHWLCGADGDGWMDG